MIMDSNEVTWLLTGSLAGVVGYLTKVLQVMWKDKKEQIMEKSSEIKIVTEALVETSKCIENNTRVMEKLPDVIFDKVQKASKL